ncbi:MAG: nitroreductase family protein [Candidatus Thermoplasmatota archaeon]|nr:nitroreductase family protein [Candidatus Thermoplasmatota archaeon]
MELDLVMEKRRSRRAYRPAEITDDMVNDLLHAAELAPSCSNNQPWRFIFVRDPQQLERVFETLSGGNYWMKRSSMVVAVFTEKGTDCDVQGVQYEMFDTGMATAFLLLKAVEMGLLTHPIAGFNKEKVKKVLGLGEQFIIITLIGMGKRSDDPGGLSEKHREQEVSARVRRPHEEISFMDRYRSG